MVSQLLLILFQLRYNDERNESTQLLDGMSLRNNNLTAIRSSSNNSDYEPVFGTTSMQSGRSYWEIRIDKYVEHHDIILGISLEGSPELRFDNIRFWGWICTSGSKFMRSRPGGKHDVKEYGGTVKIGDTVGVLFEFKGEIGYLTFLKNGSSLGTCWNNIPPGKYNACAFLFYEGVQLSLNPNAKLN